MKNSQDIGTYVKGANDAFNILGGSVISFAGLIILLSNEIQTASQTSLFMNAHVWYMRLFGFAFMYVSAFIMKAQWVSLFRKLPGLDDFAVERSNLTLYIIAMCLTVAIIVIGWIMAFVPYIGYLFAVLFVFGYLSLVKKLSRSKSTAGKIGFIFLSLIILLILLSVVAYIYLTREG